MICSCMTVKKVNDAAPSKSYSIFIDQMNGFIQKAKPMSVYGGKRNIYPCMIEYISDISICFSAEVLKEEFYLKKLKFSHYLLSDGEIILIGFSPKISSSETGILRAHPIDSVGMAMIRSRILLGEPIITGTSPGLVYCDFGNKKESTFYEMREQMPPSKIMFERLQVLPEDIQRSKE